MFVRNNTKKIKPYLKKNYKELTLDVSFLPKLIELEKEMIENHFKRYDEILCNHKYDLLRRPHKIYYLIGKITELLDKNTCSKLLYFSLYSHNRLSFSQSDYRYAEFVAGKKFGIEPKYLLFKKNDIQKNFYDFNKKEFYEITYSHQDIINEISNIYPIKEYKIVKFKNISYYAVTLK